MPAQAQFKQPFLVQTSSQTANCSSKFTLNRLNSINILCSVRASNDRRKLDKRPNMNLVCASLALLEALATVFSILQGKPK
jgi:hypothetical protein